MDKTTEFLKHGSAGAATEAKESLDKALTQREIHDAAKEDTRIRALQEKDWLIKFKRVWSSDGIKTGSNL